MTASQGQNLRRAGLATEALCMIGLLGLARGHVEIWKGFPVDPSILLSAGLGVGFLLWASGTVILIKRRRDDAGR